MQQLYHHLKDDKTENREMIVCAIVIGIADILVTLTDFIWLICDYYHAQAPHHPYIGTALAIGLIVMLASFVWLWRAIKRRIDKRKRRQQQQWERTHKMYSVPKHCDVGKKCDRVKIDYSRYEGLD